jgi:LysM repeat protein
MSRRDTIIVAVLINAGLLIVLFASALKSSSPGDEFVAVPKPVSYQAASTPVPGPSSAPLGDEVDVALSQYQAPQSVPSTPIKQEPVAVAAPAAHPFVEEFTFLAPPEVRPTPAPVTAAAQPARAQDVIDHRVKKGDVLEKIARHHHCSVDQIMKLNQLTTTNLRIGQLLKIPVNASTGVAVATSSAPQSVDASPKYYTVKNGDNPWTIAVKNHLKVDELLKLNDLNEEKARRLKPGDQLRIR